MPKASSDDWDKPYIPLRPLQFDPVINNACHWISCLESYVFLNKSTILILLKGKRIYFNTGLSVVWAIPQVWVRGSVLWGAREQANAQLHCHSMASGPWLCRKESAACCWMETKEASSWMLEEASLLLRIESLWGSPQFRCQKCIC